MTEIGDRRGLKARLRSLEWQWQGEPPPARQPFSPMTNHNLPTPLHSHQINPCRWTRPMKTAFFAKATAIKAPPTQYSPSRCAGPSLARNKAALTGAGEGEEMLELGRAG